MLAGIDVVSKLSSSSLIRQSCNFSKFLRAGCLNLIGISTVFILPELTISRMLSLHQAQQPQRRLLESAEVYLQRMADRQPQRLLRAETNVLRAPIILTELTRRRRLKPRLLQIQIHWMLLVQPQTVLMVAPRIRLMPSRKRPRLQKLRRLPRPPRRQRLQRLQRLQRTPKQPQTVLMASPNRPVVSVHHPPTVKSPQLHLAFPFPGTQPRSMIVS